MTNIWRQKELAPSDKENKGSNMAWWCPSHHFSFLWTLKIFAARIFYKFMRHWRYWNVEVSELWRYVIKHIAFLKVFGGLLLCEKSSIETNLFVQVFSKNELTWSFEYSKLESVIIKRKRVKTASFCIKPLPGTFLVSKIIYYSEGALILRWKLTVLYAHKHV